MSRASDNLQPPKTMSSKTMVSGRIIKGIGGFYYIHVFQSGVYECRAKGIFRKDGKKPLVGDDVIMQILDADSFVGNVEEILPRRSELIRPAVANIDQVLIAFALTKPEPNCNLLDRYLLMMRQKNIECIICFNKQDIANEQQRRLLMDSYLSCGYQVISLSALQETGVDELREVLCNKTTAIAGPSGVGKSTLINAICHSNLMKTGQISEKIERGKHTTRHTELFPVGNEKDTYIMDTPGFSSLEVPSITKEELPNFYPEFTSYEKNCKFGGCSHIHEPVCGVKIALDEGKISTMRYDNYCKIYEEIKNRDERYSR